MRIRQSNNLENKSSTYPDLTALFPLLPQLKEYTKENNYGDFMKIFNLSLKLKTTF